jgi:hypothetical protein
LNSQNPAGAEVLRAEYFGTNGQVGNCVMDGVASGWIGFAASTGCLKRCNEFSAFHSPESVSRWISQSTTYEQLRLAIENGPHAVVHSQLGGGCGDFSKMSSANDPSIFILISFFLTSCHGG